MDDDDNGLNFLEPSDQPGALGRLAHYDVLEVLGKGAFGTVVKAFDERLRRMVAIKVLDRSLAGTSPPRKRFLREARAAAAVRHENVVSIYAVEEQPVPYLVMEYIAGPTLQQKLDQCGPMDAAEVVRVGRQIAAGLAAAHAQGLIHRDIKPGNILLEDGADRVKITDFGLARAVDDASLTQSGVIAGTPAYMSPEQALGAPIDQRSDLFSLGSVLYVMCTGRPPFRAPTGVAVLRRVVEDTPRPIREVIAGVPEWLCTLIARLHAKDPTERFASAREVAELLQGHQMDTPARGKPTPIDSELLTAGASREVVRRSPRARPYRAVGCLIGLVTAVVAVPLLGVLSMVAYLGLSYRSAPLAQTRDARAGTATLGPWGQFFDPRGGSFALLLEPHRLTITVPGDAPRDLNPTPGFSMDAPRSLQPVDGDFTAQVAVLPFARPGPSTTYTNGADSYHGAGLVVWIDARNLLRFELAGQAQSDQGAPFTHLELFRDSKKTDEELRWTPSGSTYLRIERRENRLALFTSDDGRSWANYKTCEIPGMPQRVLVGIAAINSEAKEFVAQFEGWSLRRSRVAMPDGGR